MQEGNYYLAHKKSMMKWFDEVVKAARVAARSRLDAASTGGLTETARIEFESLLPELPYVGGAKSPFTSLMLNNAATVAMYRACKERHMEDREIGQWMYEIAEEYVKSISPLKKKLARMMVLSGSAKRRWKKWMLDTQKKEYPGNWVGDYVEGDGKTFEYGLNFTECACLKLLHRFGADDIAPYACLSDYAKMRGIGVGFKRTQILSLGHPLCDFRFVKDYETPSGWPPEKLDEFKRNRQGPVH